VAPDLDDAIRTIVRDQAGLPVDVAKLGEADDLYAAGLTSHATVNLMLGLEERFDVEFPDSLLKRGTFASIAAIRDAVTGLLGEKAAA
jgi:acyl carrier protein